MKKGADIDTNPSDVAGPEAGAGLAAPHGAGIAIQMTGTDEERGIETDGPSLTMIVIVTKKDDIVTTAMIGIETTGAAVNHGAIDHESPRRANQQAAKFTTQKHVLFNPNIPPQGVCLKEKALRHGQNGNQDHRKLYKEPGSASCSLSVLARWGTREGAEESEDRGARTGDSDASGNLDDHETVPEAGEEKQHASKKVSPETMRVGVEGEYSRSPTSADQFDRNSAKTRQSGDLVVRRVGARVVVWDTGISEPEREVWEHGSRSTETGHVDCASSLTESLCDATARPQATRQDELQTGLLRQY